MPNSEASFTGESGETYTLRYTTNALYLLERESGRSMLQLGEDFGRGAVGFRELVLMVWAGIEGHRLKTKARAKPYTIEEVGDIIDDAGGMQAVGPVIAAAAANGFAAIAPDAATAAAPGERPTPEG